MMFEFGFLDEDSQEGRSRRYVGHLQAISASRHYGLQRSLLGRRRNQPRLFKSQCYLRSSSWGHLEPTSQIGTGEGAEPQKQCPGRRGVRGGIATRQTLLTVFQTPVERFQVVLPPTRCCRHGRAQQRWNRILGLGAEHRARHQPGERQRRSAESKQLRSHGDGERGRPSGAAWGRAVERCPRKLMDLGPALKKVDLLGPQLINERSERRNGIAGGQQRVEALQRVIGGRIGLVSADRKDCNSKKDV